jgi:hypothetical protein
MDTCEKCYEESDLLNDDLVCENCLIDIVDFQTDFYDKYDD